MFKPENASRVSSLSVLSPHRQFQFHKRGQLFIGPHNEPLSHRRDVRQQSKSFRR
jgi:hypothetical protein